LITNAFLRNEKSGTEPIGLRLRKFANIPTPSDRRYIRLAVTEFALSEQFTERPLFCRVFVNTLFLRAQFRRNLFLPHNNWIYLGQQPAIL